MSAQLSQHCGLDLQSRQVLELHALPLFLCACSLQSKRTQSLCHLRARTHFQPHTHNGLDRNGRECACVLVWRSTKCSGEFLLAASLNTCARRFVQTDLGTCNVHPGAVAAHGNQAPVPSPQCVFVALHARVCLPPSRVHDGCSRHKSISALVLGMFCICAAVCEAVAVQPGAFLLHPPMELSLQLCPFLVVLKTRPTCSTPPSFCKQASHLQA